MIRFVDLFSGIGGLRLAFENATKKSHQNSKCTLSSEIDKKACETYKLNFGEDSYRDIKDCKNIPDFDFLLAGFPCQPFSYAGERKGFGDTRGTLFFEIERILKEKKPKAFLLENVRGLTTHDNGRTFQTIITALESLGYGVSSYMLNSCNYSVPQNRMRVYILGVLAEKPILDIVSEYGPADSHKFKNYNIENSKTVADILETKVDKKYYCTEKFTAQLREVTQGHFKKLHGVRLIDYRGGNSLHSWELGLKGKCSEDEIHFMNTLISNRRLKKFGANQDGKKLTKDQIKTFYKNKNFDQITKSLIEKGYLQITEQGGYNPKCGNMSFEVFKFLDPKSISITLVSSDAHRIGVVGGDGLPRRITPREAARIQGFPDNFILHPADAFAYKQLGNSVSVPVVEFILEKFFEKYSALFKENKKIRNRDNLVLESVI